MKMAENDDFFDAQEQTQPDEQFFERADEFIALANQFADSSNQVSHLSAPAGNVSASFMYANARYSVWHAACSYNNVTDFKADRATILEYYTKQFKMMLEDHLDEYLENFEEYFPKSDDDNEEAKPSFS